MSALDPHLQRLARVTAAIVLGDWALLRAVRRAAGPGEPDRAWREAVLQAHLFAGFPRWVEACEVLELEGGLGTPDPAELEPPELEREGLEARGAPLFDSIYAASADGVRRRLAELHPDGARWILEHAYGRVLSRDGLDPAARELLAVAGLLASRQERQLASHARGAVRCGATPAAVLAVADALAADLDAVWLARARGVIERFAR